jgi:hypothetical protein
MQILQTIQTLGKGNNWISMILEVHLNTIHLISLHSLLKEEDKDVKAKKEIKIIWVVKVEELLLNLNLKKEGTLNLKLKLNSRKSCMRNWETTISKINKKIL